MGRGSWNSRFRSGCQYKAYPSARPAVKNGSVRAIHQVPSIASRKMLTYWLSHLKPSP
jgi:hypothetical protein